MRTRAANRFTTTSTEAMAAGALELKVLTTANSPASPCYLVIEPNVTDRAEVALFDGDFDGTTLRTSSLANRYLPGSASPSDIVHPEGSLVVSAPLGSHIEDLWDDMEGVQTTVAPVPGHIAAPNPHTGSASTAALTAHANRNDNPHQVTLAQVMPFRGIRRHRTSGRSVPNGTSVVIGWHSSQHQQGEWQFETVDGQSGNPRPTIAGWYTGLAQVSWAPSNAGWRALGWWVDGTHQGADQHLLPMPGGSTNHQSALPPTFLNGSQTPYVTAFQNSGGALQVQHGAASFIALWRVG